ncbi:MAG: peptidase M50 [Rhodopirellula sp.]|uniref:site-2 protease family protein n=1 Tax=Rhodopirellula TaxID=265488 RepID=UPI000C68DE6E|nr:site-2 protease family protein [Rhodopirellula sp. UBA1907]MAP07913.1 peptidase M50 [Rhodopirellula sp.]
MSGSGVSLVAAVRAKESQPNDWRRQTLVLLVSLALFVAVGLLWWDLRLVLMLVGILLLHEGGHFVAMRAFGYRNIRMVFVPMLGAAVSGQPIRIPRWKKAIVYFAGPLPGIAISMVLLLIASAGNSDANASVSAVPILLMNSSHPWLLELGGLGLLLNWMNLLPLLPLDGGRIVQSTFARPSPWREVLGRVLTMLVIAGLSISIGEPWLLLLIFPLLFTMPLTYRTCWLSRRLSEDEIPPPTESGVPEAAIETIASAIDETALRALAPPQKASLVLQLYESLIAPPPTPLASRIVGLVYLGSIMVSTLFGWWIWSLHRWHDPAVGEFDRLETFVNETGFDKGSQIILPAFTELLASTSLVF